MKNEGDVKKVIKQLLNSLDNCYWFMPPANGFGRSGIPDFVGHVNGKFFAIETKFGGNKPTPNQEREIAKINESGAVAHVVSEKNLDEFITQFIKWAKQC